jgi:hypothetical protein
MRREKERKRTHDLQVASTSEPILQRNHAIVDKFLEIAERKVSVIDEYGHEQWDDLPEEIPACMKKIAQREGRHLDLKEYAKTKRQFGSNDWSAPMLNRLVPEEYVWIENRLEQLFSQRTSQTARDAPTFS